MSVAFKAAVFASAFLPSSCGGLAALLDQAPRPNWEHYAYFDAHPMMTNVEAHNTLIRQGFSPAHCNLGELGDPAENHLMREITCYEDQPSNLAVIISHQWLDGEQRVSTISFRQSGREAALGHAVPGDLWLFLDAIERFGAPSDIETVKIGRDEIEHVHWTVNPPFQIESLMKDDPAYIPDRVTAVRSRFGVELKLTSFYVLDQSEQARRAGVRRGDVAVPDWTAHGYRGVYPTMMARDAQWALEAQGFDQVPCAFPARSELEGDALPELADCYLNEADNRAIVTRNRRIAGREFVCRIRVSEVAETQSATGLIQEARALFGDAGQLRPNAPDHPHRAFWYVNAADDISFPGVAGPNFLADFVSVDIGSDAPAIEMVSYYVDYMTVEVDEAH